MTVDDVGVTLSGPVIAVSKQIWQEVGGMILSLAAGIVIRAPDKTSVREFWDVAIIPLS